jgi:hypothetical protein
MSKKPKIRNWRAVTPDGRYCSLDTSLTELGVCIPNRTQADAHVFTSVQKINNAIQRTYSLQKEVRASLYPHYPRFKELLAIEGEIHTEEFEP